MSSSGWWTHKLDACRPQINQCLQWPVGYVVNSPLVVRFRLIFIFWSVCGNGGIFAINQCWGGHKQRPHSFHWNLQFNNLVCIKSPRLAVSDLKMIEDARWSSWSGLVDRLHLQWNRSGKFAIIQKTDQLRRAMVWSEREMNSFVVIECLYRRSQKSS